MRSIFATIVLAATACSSTPAPVVTTPAPAAPAVTQPPPMSEDARAALATVQRLFDAMRTRDTAAMRMMFDANARLYGLRTRRDSTVVVQAITGKDFIGAVAASANGPAWNERMFDPEVRVSGPLATVWTEYDFHAGTTFSHCGVDAIQLLKVGETWKIVSITDTLVRAGCTARALQDE